MYFKVTLFFQIYNFGLVGSIDIPRDVLRLFFLSMIFMHWVHLIVFFLHISFIYIHARFVSLDCISTFISFDIYIAIKCNTLSFQPTCKSKRTTREATQPIIFAALSPSSHLFPFARARARSCAFVYSGGKNSLVPHTHTSLFLLSRCEDEAYKKKLGSMFSVFLFSQ
jgi:hypothetical protein